MMKIAIGILVIFILLAAMMIIGLTRWELTRQSDYHVVTFHALTKAGAKARARNIAMSGKWSGKTTLRRMVR